MRRGQRLLLRLSNGWGNDLLLLGLLLVLIFWWYWPALRMPYHLLPVREHTAATVPYLNAWTIWWNADRLYHGLRGYWDAPIFFPEKGALAFSEPQPFTMLLAPLVWASGTPVLAYHAYLIIALLLNSYTGALLCREIGLGRSAQWMAAVGMLFHPLAHRNFDVLQWVPIWPTLWLLTCLVRFRHCPTVKEAVFTAVALIAGFYVCVHHAFLVLCVVFATLIGYLPWSRLGEFSRSAAVGLVIAAIGVVPVLWSMQSIAGQQGFSRDEKTVRAGSAHLEDWCRVPQTMWLPGKIALAAAGHPSLQDQGRPMLPGVVRLVLACMAIVFVLRGEGRRRWSALWLTALAVISGLLSLGTHLAVGGFSIWRLLGSMPGFGMIRSPYRFGYLTQECLIVLAAMGWDYLVRRVARSSGDRTRPKRLPIIGLAVLGMILATEMWPARPRVVVVPDLRDPPAWVAYLRDHAVEEKAVLCLPFGVGANLQDFEPAGRWMFFQVVHRRPLVNGYSGFFPDSWYRLASAIARAPFSEQTLMLLREHGVGYIVLDQNRLREPLDVPQQVGNTVLHSCFYDPIAEVTILELRTPEEPPRDCPGMGTD